VAGAVSFLAWAVAYVVLALVPSYTTSLLHSHNLLLGGTAAGLLLLCAATAQFLLAGWTAAQAQTTGLILLIAGLGGLIATSLVASIPLLLATIALAGSGQGLAFMAATRNAIQLAAPLKTVQGWSCQLSIGAGARPCWSVLVVLEPMDAPRPHIAGPSLPQSRTVVHVLCRHLEAGWGDVDVELDAQATGQPCKRCHGRLTIASLKPRNGGLSHPEPLAEFCL
jgi:hypothetical protein